MNILFITADSIKNGANLSMIKLIELLEKKGVKIKVIVPANGQIIEELKNKKIDYQIVKSYQWIKDAKMGFNIIYSIKKVIKIMLNKIAIYKISKIIKKNNIDIVHINSLSNYVGAKAAIKTKTKLIWHFREFLEEDHGITIWNNKKGFNIISKADKIIAISKSVYNKFEPIYGKNKVEMIYNGLDIEKYLDKDKKIMKKDTINILMAGKITKSKGQKELIEAISKVKQYANWQVFIAGNEDKTYVDELKEYIKDNNLNNEVNILGFCDNIPELQKNADICTVCSRYEAFGRVSIESMLAGNLVVGADTAATKELIENNVNGILYKQGDSDDLAKKLINIVNNKEKMRNIASYGRDYAKENFTAQKNADNIFELYKKILK